MSVEQTRTGSGFLARGVTLAAGLFLCLPLVHQTAHAQTERVEKLGVSDQVKIEVGKGQVIRLPRPAATVFVADPDIADVQAQSPSIIYLFGRRAGSTSMFAVDENDNLLLRSSVQVDHNLSGLRSAIDRLIPGHAIDVSSVDGSIVLEGEIASPGEATNSVTWQAVISARRKRS